MSTTQTLGISFAMGLALFGLTMLLSWIHITYGWNANLLKWLLLPTLGYMTAFGMNTLLQYTTCTSVKVEQIALASAPVGIAILGGLLITLLPFIRSPITSILTGSTRSIYGGAYAVAFYMFWAGMFGEAIASGMAQSCGK
jgi:hypothetical protein